jgi:outer membrane protein assembly factor BamE
MQKYILILTVLIVSSLLTGCSTLQFPGVYKIAVEQGNIITQEMIDQLKPGMSRDQVEYIMGTALVKDSFNSDRWDYVYTIRRGDQDLEQQRMSIFFKADNLDYFTGDFIPTPTENTDTENDETTPQPQES